MEFATLPDREDQDDAASCAERCVQLLLIHRQRGPNTLKVTGRNMRLGPFTRFCQPHRLRVTESDLGFSQGHILMVVALDQEESSVSQDVTQLTAGILTGDELS